MAVKICYYAPPNPGNIGEPSVIKKKWVENTFKGLLLPHQKVRDRVALEILPVHFYYYRYITRGRRCSCWYPSSDTSAKKMCPNCWGVGLVPGYTKFGCVDELIETSRPDITTVNIAPAWDLRIRPVPLGLIKTALQGYVECSIPLSKNKGVIDSLSTSMDSGECGEMKSFVKAPDEKVWTEMTPDAVRTRLGNSSIRFRLYLTRRNLKGRAPYIINLHLRYKVGETVVLANIPKFTEAESIFDLGLEDSISSITMWLLPPISDVLGKRDFFRRIKDGTLWKVTSLSKLTPMDDQTISVDADARWVQAYEHYHNVPM